MTSTSDGDTDAQAFQLRLLGKPLWRAADGRQKELSRNDALLLALLAIDGPQAGHVLAGRVWPDKTQAQAANNLRQRVMRLRDETGQPLFHTRRSVSLADGIQIDVRSLATMNAEPPDRAGRAARRLRLQRQRYCP